jgi:hypothetical protein
MSSEFNKRRKWLDGGDNSAYPLLNSIRRSLFSQNQLEKERALQGADPRYPNRLFPDEYREKKGDNRRVLDADKAGVINLGQEMSLGGRVIRPRNGLLRILDGDILDKNFSMINERNKWIDGLAGLCLSDDTGQIARYIIPAVEYNLLQKGTGGSGMPPELTNYSGRPEVIANYPPNDREYTNGVAKLRYVIKLAESSIHFDSSIEQVLSKYNLYGQKGSKGSGSCCC